MTLLYVFYSERIAPAVLSPSIKCAAANRRTRKKLGVFASKSVLDFHFNR